MKRDTIFSGISILAMILFALLSMPGLASHQDDHGGMTTGEGTHAADPAQDEDQNGDHAEDSGHGDQEEATHGEEAGHGAAGDDDHGGHDDVGLEKARALAVHEPPSWYPKVAWGAVVLFVLAMTLGSLAIVAKGPEPSDPADSHDRDDHHH